jgi:hypothetical protein
MCREAHAGASTEAYYCGNSLAHLVVVLLAPLAFLTPYYSLAGPRAPFLSYYAVLVTVYLFVSGLAYLCSIVLPETLAGLVGILSILMMFCFSGANPTLKTLSDPARLWGVLVYPTYVSFMRWAQECFYLMELKQYQDEYYVLPEAGLFSYTFGDVQLDWMMMLAMTIFVRVCAYTVLVTREP